MATKLLMFAALAFGLAAIAAAQSDCRPTYSPKFDCNNDAAPGWLNALTMMYKYFPRELKQADATQVCRPYDEEICSRSRGFQSYLVSYLTDKEWEEAILKAYDDACIKNGDLFWTGVRAIYKGKLYYTDSSRSRSSKHAFPGGMPRKLPEGQCVAVDGRTREMVLRDCNLKLPFMCKIMPSSH